MSLEKEPPSSPPPVNSEAAHFIQFTLQRTGTLLQAGKINDGDVLLYALLSGFAYNRKGWCQSSNRWLAWRLGKSVRVIQERIANLVAAGLVEVREQDEQRWFKVTMESDPNFPVIIVSPYTPHAENRIPSPPCGKPHPPHAENRTHKHKVINNDNTHSPVARGECDGDLFGNKDSMTEDEKQARQISDALRGILAKARKLSPSSKTGRGWYLEVLKAVRTPEYNLTLEELQQPLSDLPAYLASDADFKPEFESMSGYLAKFRKIVTAIERWKNPRSASGASPIDAGLLERVRVAYQRYCADNGTPEWPKALAKDAIDALARSATNFSAMRRGVTAAYNECADALEKGKPARDSEDFKEWDSARVFCNAVDAMAFFDHNLNGFIEWWMKPVRKKMKTWKPESLTPFIFKPESKMFREYVTSLGHEAASLDHILSYLAK